MRILLALSFCLVFAAAQISSAAAETRFVVQSDNAADKAELELHHEFPGAFTAALSGSQVRSLKRRGIRVRRVKRLRYLRPWCSPWPACKNGTDPTPTPTPTPAGRSVLPSDQTPWGIEAVYGSTSIAATSGGAGVSVAVVDGGVDRAHPDLARRLQQCVDFTGKGKRSIVEGRCSDGADGHGTHVSGTILADAGADGLGIYGVAPQAALLSYKVCKSSCWSDDIAAAIDYAGSHGAQIVSMSLGGDAESSLIRDAVARNPHLLIISAAGNDGPGAGTIDFPAGNAAVVAVGALQSDLSPASFSTRGVNDGDYVVEYREVELAAPGVDIESTVPGGGYAIWDGTSMATPHVSGLAAKFWQGSAAATRAFLHGLALDVDAPGDDPATGFGLPVAP